jgi:hypothetical protein
MTELQHAQAMLEHYREAEVAALAGKSVTLNGRTFVSHDPAAITKGRLEWEQRVYLLTYGRGPRFGRVSFE